MQDKPILRARIKFTGSAKAEIYGARFLVRKRHYQLREMIAKGPQAVLMKTESLCTPRTLFLDIGANVGIFSLIIAARKGSRVFAFEPVPSTFSALVTNLSLNPSLQVTPFNIALSNHQGDVDMVAEDASGINRIISGAGLHRLRAEGIPVQRVPAVPLDIVDALLPAADFERIVVKIDVERHERAVLEGGTVFLTRPEPMVLCIEVDRDTSVIDALLRDAGFAELTQLSDPRDRFYANQAWQRSVGE